MLDQHKNINEIKNIIRNKNYTYFIQEPISDLTVEFLDDFSKLLKKQKNIYQFADLTYLIFWTRKSKIANLKLENDNETLKLGRGIAFHVCPSNIPTNFIYSFFFGLLSGNSNIIKMSSAKSKEKSIILYCLKKLFNKKKYKKIKNSTHFFEYDYLNNEKITQKLSMNCDARVIWGSDQTINKIKSYPSKERCVDIFFPDRYSISIINSTEYKKLNDEKKNILANRFYYDSYSMNQLGCNSPQIIFWIGKNIEQQSIFWKKLNSVVDKKLRFKQIEVVDKYLRLLEIIIDNEKQLGKVYKINNNIYILENKKKNIENLRGLNGIFFQMNLSSLSDIKKYITKKCQTASYFGFRKENFEQLFFNSNILGIDRVVPIGKSLEIDTIWDGYDIVRSLSRNISLK